MRGQDILDKIRKQRKNIKMMKNRVSKLTDLNMRKENEDILDNLELTLDEFEKEINLVREKDKRSFDV